jgi:hypothetical protein
MLRAAEFIQTNASGEDLASSARLLVDYAFKMADDLEKKYHGSPGAW